MYDVWDGLDVCDAWGVGGITDGAGDVGDGGVVDGGDSSKG